ncbi:AAA family ATPase [Pseudacidobacterium ailaaui]|uniref:AAA family ATPase n=1 Tax=Pseudacidobacterium ailaaui TaxID=1382359 RepID=UPI000678E0E2|nr:MoxR family ATPase [Pseudacidobacterium ailaaui]
MSGTTDQPSKIQQRLDHVFSTPQVLLQELAGVGYLTDMVTAHAVWYAYKLDRPILQEGPAGAGKTQLALSLGKATGMEIIRLQCYTGITDDKAIGRYDRALQELFVLAKREEQMDFSTLRKEISNRKFFLPGPLLQAIESPTKCILLIDEIDKVPHEFEAMLLELLSVWEISAPGLGTIAATTRPLTILTSNAERDLADPLRRRSVYLMVQHPTPEIEARIVSLKTQALPIETHVFIAGLAKTLRIFSLRKPPSISEMSDIAQAMELLGKTSILPEDRELFLPLLAKRPEDIDSLRLREKFSAIVIQAKDFVTRAKLHLAVRQGRLRQEVLQLKVEQIRASQDLQQLLKDLEFTEFPGTILREMEAETGRLGNRSHA